uniref:Uncharacterized protein n=1 Tax=Timema bartmani TaxID=61472 RepID=A0A7R9EQA3_9NEOP|nr:unnamed protein product [Timema bartmani]
MVMVLAERRHGRNTAREHQVTDITEPHKQDSEELSIEGLKLYHIKDVSKHSVPDTKRQPTMPAIKLSLRIDSMFHTIKVDTGAALMLISEETYKVLWPHQPKLESLDLDLRTWAADTPLRVLGSKSVEVQFLKIRDTLALAVVTGHGPSILGNPWFEPLGFTLCSLPGSFANLTKLYFCDLYDNLLDAVPVELQKLLSLQSLDLEYNHFSTSDLLEKHPENELFSKYETLKTNLRQQREFYHQRYNCQRPEESPDYNNTSEDATDNELEDVSSGSFAEPPAKDLSWWPSSSGPPSKEDETWDKSDSSDDSFDPHREPMIQQKMAVWDPMSQSDPHLHRNNFCPADMHQKSIRSKKKVTLPNPVECQFEDACFDDTDVNPTNIRFLLKDNL